MMLLLLFLTVNVWGRGLVIYGEDNRVDTYRSNSSLYKRLATSTAAHIHKSNIRERGNSVELSGPSLGQAFLLCKKERFVHQPIIANCSGFLVAPDIIATAGHCMESKSDCSQYRWVFDFKVDDENQSAVSVTKNDVYACKEIIKQALDDTLDFALVRLDRPVTGRTPVTISRSEILPGTPLVMIGHPSGLPQKIADHANVKEVSKLQFTANLDAFQINSGSAVFNATNGELLGILVKGSRDYKTNSEHRCSEVNVLKDVDGSEGVSSYTQFLPHLNK